MWWHTRFQEKWKVIPIVEFMTFLTNNLLIILRANLK